MTSTDPNRLDSWLDELIRTLGQAAVLVQRGRAQFDSDAALPLAFEALSNRVGDLAKKLVLADPVRFTDPMWSLAARNRDFVVHHYSRVDLDALWNTIAHDFPRLALLAATRRAESETT